MQAAEVEWKFVPETLDAADLSALEGLFSDLQARDFTTVEDVMRWLTDESEVSARISAEKARRYIQKTCHTDDEAAKASYLSMEQDVMPRVKVLGDALDRKLLDSPLHEKLGAAFEVLIRKRRTARAIFREENTELSAEESTLQTRQQALMGALTVTFEGEEYTPQQIAPFLMDPDRERRRQAHDAVLASRRGTWDELNEIYDELIALRDKMARNADCADYTEFRFQQLMRFDYSPKECRQFHDAVEQVVVPAVGRLNEQRRTALSVDTLRPYDLEVDLESRDAFRPFSTDPELRDIVRRIFKTVDPRFADEFSLLEDHDLLDLMSRKGKAPGGYQYALEDVRLPFIFCNSVGTHNDVQTLLHEGGHAFHSILSRHHELVAYRHAPIEFAETASMSMELMGLEEVATVYGDEEAQRTRRTHLEGLLRILPWIASIDAFQHWVYGNPGHDRAARETAWLEVMDRFSPGPERGGIDSSGYEDARRNRWTAQGHLYGHPFYYIEYGIAQLAALQVWQAYRRDKTAAIEAYRAGLSLGGSRPLPELFAAAGVRFDLSAETLGSLVADIEAVMAQ